MAEEPSLWGWGRPQRTLLAVVVVGGAVCLLLTSRTDEATGGAAPGSVAVDVNTAPPSVLLALPGLGPGRVDSIVAAREEGPFASLDDLAWRVKGIGPATIAGIRPFVRFGPAPEDDGSPPGTDSSPRPSPRERGEGG